MAIKIVIPQDPNSIVLELNDSGDLVEIGLINVGFKSIHHVTENGWIISCNQNNKKLKIFDNNLNLVHTFTNLKLNSIISKYNKVYLGGENNKKYIGLMELDLNKQHLELKPFKYQKEIRKSVDDLQIHDTKLIVYDNFIIPKIIFEYDISHPKNPQKLSEKKIRFPGTYQHIKKARINDLWEVIWTTSMNHGYAANHINVFGEKEYYKSFGIPSPFKHDPVRFHIYDFELNGKWLFVLVDGFVLYANLEGFDKSEFNTLGPVNKGSKKLFLSNNILIISGIKKYKTLNLEGFPNNRIT